MLMMFLIFASAALVVWITVFVYAGWSMAALTFVVPGALAFVARRLASRAGIGRSGIRRARFAAIFALGAMVLCLGGTFVAVALAIARSAPQPLAFALSVAAAAQVLWVWAEPKDGALRTLKRRRRDERDSVLLAASSPIAKRIAAATVRHGASPWEGGVRLFADVSATSSMERSSSVSGSFIRSTTPSSPV